MRRVYDAVADLMVETHGSDIWRLPWAKLAEMANQLVEQGFVLYMDPVGLRDWTRLESAVKAASERARIAKIRADAALPKLAGNPKLVRWAEEIRRDGIRETDERQRRARMEGDAQELFFLTAFDAKDLRTETRANWFIENRKWFGIQDKDGRMVSDAQAEAVAEMTLMPAKRMHPSAVEIQQVGSGLRALYRYDEDFVRVVRGQGLKWNASAKLWVGRVGNGTVNEQVFRLAMALLAEGFAVMTTVDEGRAIVRARGGCAGAGAPHDVSALAGRE